MTVIQTPYGPAEFKTKSYSNLRMAIYLEDPVTQALIAVLTVNIPDVHLADDEFFVKTWSENETISEICRQSGLFEDTGKRQPTGFVFAEIWKLSDKGKEELD